MKRIKTIGLYCLLMLFLAEWGNAQEVRGKVLPDCAGLQRDQEFWNSHFATKLRYQKGKIENVEEFLACEEEKKKRYKEFVHYDFKGWAWYYVHIDTAGKVDFICARQEVNPELTNLLLECVRITQWRPWGRPGKRKSQWSAIIFRIETD